MKNIVRNILVISVMASIAALGLTGCKKKTTAASDIRFKQCLNTCLNNASKTISTGSQQVQTSIDNRGSKHPRGMRPSDSVQNIKGRDHPTKDATKNANYTQCNQKCANELKVGSSVSALTKGVAATSAANSVND